MNLDEPSPDEWLDSNASAFLINATPGEGRQLLVLPRRAIGSWLDAYPAEQSDLWEMVREARDKLSTRVGERAVRVSFVDGSTDRLTISVSVEDADGEQPPGADVDMRATSFIGARDGRFLRLELLRALRDPGFDRIDLLVSFIMKSGIQLIGDHLEAAVERGASVRVLTTDYQRITDADALARMLDMSEDAEAEGNRLEIRVFSDPMLSFHPKAYLFHASEDHRARGFVGSNNLSRSGIDAGVEWSLATDNVDALVESFDALWLDPRSKHLSHDWLRGYRSAWRKPVSSGDPMGVEPEAELEAPQPRPLQAEALEALTLSRSAGFEAGLVVMATGLGKTWLAAFDSAAGFGRTLFVAHREEILSQSRDVFRQVRPDAELGLYSGTEKQPDADVVFASVQTLHRHLDDFEPTEFGYVVVDEFHHAAAASYRAVLDHFSPRFLLGLTATPERMDGADLLGLCGDNLVFECGLVEGIDRGELVPFHYWGIKDAADYEGIPWRSGRFDPAMLAERIETQNRAAQAFEEWELRCGERTLAFCASVSHAEFMADYFGNRGVAAVAVHSKPGSSDRRDALARLREGSVEVLFAVDMFNEGVDVPEVESVLMLRPTESPVVFLQQMGRGLRLSDGKDHLDVIDFVGNHRSFLLHPRVLLGMTGESDLSNARVQQVLTNQDWDLPAGCSVTFDVEAIDLLQLLVERNTSVGDALTGFVLDFSSEHETRPTASQAAAAGYNPAASHKSYGSWFGLLQHLGLLEPTEFAALDSARDILTALETEKTTKSYKLVALRALLSMGALRDGTEVNLLAAESQRIVAADPRLVADTTSKDTPSPANADSQSWAGFWLRWPLEHLTKGSGGAPLFRIEGNRFEPNFEIEDGLGEAFDAMAAEILDWRLGDYLLRSNSTPSGAVRCRVSHSSGKPIVRLDRSRHPELPVGEEPIEVEGEQLVGRFAKIALNVATPPDSERNALPELLRAWFGPDAGHPGTNHHVLLDETGSGWQMRPERPEASGSLGDYVGQRFKRQDVPGLFGLEFNPGNWNSGHVSLPDRNAVVLFVTLTKTHHMSHGSDYEDYFESATRFVWSSQTSVGPDSKKGTEILEAKRNGTTIHLFARQKKTDAFEYRGTLTPIAHEGDRPMSVTFELR